LPRPPVGRAGRSVWTPHRSVVPGTNAEKGLLQDGFDFAMQAWEIFLDNVPHLIQINPEVIMHRDIPEPGNTSPVYIRMLHLECIGKSPGGFRECLKVSGDGVPSFLISEKIFLAGFCVLNNAVHAFFDMKKIKAIVFHRGLASFKTRSRIYQ
jgi:hypothetical protein